MIDLVQLNGVVTDPGVWSGLTDSQRALVIMGHNHGELVTYRHTNDVEVRFMGAPDGSVFVRKKVLKDLIESRMVKKFCKFHYRYTINSMVNIYVITDRGIKVSEAVVTAMKLARELSHA